ncbi:TetR/AcrR family transcriptional regulator [Corynebacterium breve]|uniref:TetR/AcrR family transcriptional regulator n=1 Tax=Corynebacterium breve TaxID=3049799 RepID=A0ABY8VCW0_9CORY|nr:TetR/AcrR family transcriptional regulator [Corynebacterium breve]WIM67486.1 TetR/AcrR family transcriptional regulator [Corynebacterium breve]
MPIVVDHNARRDELALAMLRIASEHGVEAVSVRGVAKQSGCSPGTVQHYFPTRDDMLRHAVGLLARRRRDQFLAIPQTDSARDMVTAAARTYLPTTDENKLLAGAGAAFYLASLHDDHLRKQTAASPKKLIEVLTELFSKAQANGELTKDIDPAKEAHFAWLLLDPGPILAGYRTVEETFDLLDYHLDRIFV